MKTYKHPNYSYITIVEIPKDEIQKVDMSLCAQPTQTLKAYYDACEVKPTIICNGGFFGMANGHTCFNYIDEGKVINVNGETEEGFGIYNNELVYGFVKDKKYTDFISAYPMLIKDGKKADITIANEINYKARRSILAYNETTIFIIAVEGSGMTFSQMQDFLLKMNVDYALLNEKIKPLKDLMEKTDKVRILGPNTDIEFSIKGMKAIPCCGTANIPDGELYTAPIKESVNGVITYNTPSPYRGNIFNNIRLEFKDGKIINCSANEHQSELEEIFNIDEGARQIGEFSLGFNPMITKPMGDILYDEKIMGSLHFTPGRCYEDCDNGNISSIHWDLV